MDIGKVIDEVVIHLKPLPIFSLLTLDVIKGMIFLLFIRQRFL